MSDAQAVLIALVLLVVWLGCSVAIGRVLGTRRD
jgi:hypothetical protein